ncbi:VOC family protein [Chondromyces apiculatus]|uniref:VOC family protein n=1 Tax=Chondromyces apiculatus TaxID=51 RepID=UPI0018CC6341|nr:VOC family protein [Chondromyces apiculatus]
MVAHRTEHTLYLRGAAPSHYAYRVERGPRARFVGAGYLVDARSDLERLAQIDGAGPVTSSEHPGRGAMVRLRDPSGFIVEVVAEQDEPARLSQRAPMDLGNVGNARRRVNATQRLPIEPAALLRLGHHVIEVSEYQATCAWYTRHLGLVPSDVQVFEDGSPAVTFLRLDRGATPTDHHTLAMAQGVMPAFGHAAFEVLDADAVGMGHRVLREKAWAHAWGIGRHLLGSQIFDYWEDPWGARHEHYCDGDLFTADQPLGVHAVSREGMAQWGPPMPRSFTKPRLSPSSLLAIARNVSRSDDLSLGKLATLARLFG